MGKKNSKPEPEKDFVNQWRNVDWDAKEHLKSEISRCQITNPEITKLKILLYGPVGAGKSCFINSTMSIFAGRSVYRIPEETSAGTSCTKTFTTYEITDANLVPLPFVLSDVMGIENPEDNGIKPEDIINALHGHVPDGYTFNPVVALNEKNQNYIKDPSPNDKVHCLVSVVPADSISLMSKEVIDKMTSVRKIALDLEIPHVVLMTKIDSVCPLVREELHQVYKSRKIQEKMELCSRRLGPPMKCVFPVSNYFKDSETNDKKDVLILMALKSIVGFANDYTKYHKM